MPVSTASFVFQMVAGVGIAMSASNLYGYIRCKIGAGANMSSMATSFLGKQVLQSVRINPGTV